MTELRDLSFPSIKLRTLDFPGLTQNNFQLFSVICYQFYAAAQTRDSLGMRTSINLIYQLLTNLLFQATFQSFLKKIN